jgi:hypothetical protein
MDGGAFLIILDILQTVALCGGALALVWLAIQASIIADYIRVYLDSHGIWLEDGAEELRTTKDKKPRRG